VCVCVCVCVCVTITYHGSESVYVNHVTCVYESRAMRVLIT
jgi:hypothetical protein